MDIKEFALNIIETYKYVGLYFLFIIDTMGVFLPSKTLLTICGVLVEQGRLNLPPLVAVTLCGSLTGFSASYFIGAKVGKPLLDNYGKYLHLTPKRFEQAENWFHKYGPAFILVAYFTPGLRHVTPYLAGITKMAFAKAFFFALCGAFLWIITFVSLGRFLRNNLQGLYLLMNQYLWEAVAVALFMLLTWVFIKVRLKPED